MSDAKPRTIVYGIDGADWHVMHPLIEAGLLPNISALLQRGGRAPLRSTIPPITSCAWPTLMSGTNPGKHGLSGFLSPTQDRSLLSNANRQVPAIWEILNRHGLSVGCFNIPLTYPPDRIEGFMVSGAIGAPRYTERLFVPSQLFAEARRVVPTYPMRGPILGSPFFRKAKCWKSLVEARHRLCMHLLRNHTPDVLIAVVEYVDWVQHYYISRRLVRGLGDAVAWAYRQADELLGLLCDAAGEDAPVVVVSDHGAGPVEGFIDINGLLHNLGFLHYRKTTSRGQLRSIWHALLLRCWLQLPTALANALWGRAMRVYQEMLDLERTVAFHVPLHGIVINAPGSSKSPAVGERDRCSVAADVAAAIAGTLNPLTGQTDIKAFQREHVYQGPATDRAPDIIVMPRDFTMKAVMGMPRSEKVFWSPDEARESRFPAWFGADGNHRLDGIVLVSPFDETHLGPANAVDIVPTVLDLLELPVPRNMDGRSLTGNPSLEADQAGERSERTEHMADAGQTPYSEQDEEALTKHLRDLGYL